MFVFKNGRAVSIHDDGSSPTGNFVDHRDIKIIATKMRLRKSPLNFINVKRRDLNGIFMGRN